MLSSNAQKKPPPQAPKPTPDEKAAIQRFVALRDRIHEGPFYTILGDGKTTGVKRKHDEPRFVDRALFNPFTDNQTWSSKYLKVRRRIPKLNSRPYVRDLFAPELRDLLESATALQPDGARPAKRQTLKVAKVTATTRIERFFQDQEVRAQEEAELAAAEVDADEEDEDEYADPRPEAVAEDDDLSAASTDSEDSDDDYNAELYFDNGDDEWGAEDPGLGDDTYE